MDRSDIGEYVGMSLSAVSRSFASLASRGIIKAKNRHYLNIVDRDAFEMIVAIGKSDVVAVKQQENKFSKSRRCLNKEVAKTFAVRGIHAARRMML